MKKFDFRLDTVLRVRQQELNVVRQELVEAELAQRDIEEAIRRVREEHTSIEEEMRQGREGRKSVLDIRNALEYLHQLQARVVRMQDDLLRAQNFTGIKRKEVAEAQQKKKMIENLKEKQYRRWQKEVSDEERNILDELATLRHSRKNGEIQDG